MESKTDNEEYEQWLLREVAIGFAQLERGEVDIVTSLEEFKKLIRSRKADSAVS